VWAYPPLQPDMPKRTPRALGDRTETSVFKGPSRSKRQHSALPPHPMPEPRPCPHLERCGHTRPFSRACQNAPRVRRATAPNPLFLKARPALSGNTPHRRRTQCPNLARAHTLKGVGDKGTGI